MKKQLLLLTFAFAMVSFLNLNAQICTPNTAYADSSFGIWPDTTTNLPCAFGNQATYEAIIDLKTLSDTTLAVEGFGEITAYISAFRIFSVTGLPPNFSYIPNVSEWQNTGTSPNFQAVQGCMTVAASQAAVNAALNGQAAVDFPIVVRVDAKIQSTDNATANALFSFPQWLSDLTSIPGIEPFPVNGYKIRARENDNNGCNPVSIGKVNGLNFTIESNIPNPFFNNTQIVVNSDKVQSAQFQVMNALGAIVHNAQIQITQGQNLIDFSANNLESGIYYYTISTSAGKITKSMLIAK